MNSRNINIQQSVMLCYISYIENGRCRDAIKLTMFVGAQETKDNPLYTLMDLNMAGLLVTTFESGGVDGVRQCMERVGTEYLYGRGSGQLITHSEYAEWRQHIDSKDKVCEVPGIVYRADDI